MNFTLKIWRQKDAKSKGAFESYKVENISADTSFLEMLDILNNNLIHEGKEPVAFDHDCREGICGMCSLHIDGHAHGPGQAATTCQIYMRKFKDGATITIEPWRSAAFPVIKDLVVNRSAYDQILQAGGFISVRTNSVPDANAIPIAQADAEESMDAAACIGCGACAATCKNGSAMLFVAARVSSLAKLPQGRVEGARRAKAMVAKMDELGMVIDTSHLSEGGFWDIVKHGKKPFVASHSCARALCDHRRNLTDEQLRALGEKGGVCGVNFYDNFLHEPEDGYTTVEDIVRHAKYIADKAGIDAVALGSDFDGISSKLEFGDFGGMGMVVDALAKSFSSADVDKICHGNALRVFEEVIG